jgi:camphor 5-monooxygenase
MNDFSKITPDRRVDFDIYAPPAVEEGFHQSWKSLQAPGMPDVVWTPHNGGHWIATRAPVINKVLADYKRFSSRTIFVPKETVGAAYRGALPGTVDPPEHKAYRTLLNARLAPKIVKEMEASIRHHAGVLVEAVREKGACDFASAFAELFPIQVLMAR